MKRLLSLFTLASLFAAFMPAMALAGECYVDPVHTYSGSGRVKSGVFLRDEACMEGSRVLVTLSAGTSVSIIGFTDGWYRVEASNGARGWVGQQFIETSATRTGTWDSYREYMNEYPSRGPTTSSPPPAPAPSGETAFTGTIQPRYLIKLVCPAGASVDHPCKAVYYIGADGKRHAFPNSRVFFTWYANFDEVRAVTAERLGQYALGSNVTYRPGARMVKFTTDPKVYAVGRGGVLRWVATEELAVTLYGSNWNTKIDDIPDAFYTNYTFGADISAASDFNVSAELEANVTLD